MKKTIIFVMVVFFGIHLGAQERYFPIQVTQRMLHDFFVEEFPGIPDSVILNHSQQVVLTSADTGYRIMAILDGGAVFFRKVVFPDEGFSANYYDHKVWSSNDSLSRGLLMRGPDLVFDDEIGQGASGASLEMGINNNTDSLLLYYQNQIQLEKVKQQLLDEKKITTQKTQEVLNATAKVVVPKELKTKEKKERRAQKKLDRQKIKQEEAIAKQKAKDDARAARLQAAQQRKANGDKTLAGQVVEIAVPIIVGHVIAAAGQIPPPR